MSITHGWTTADPNDPAYDVSATNLNAHTVPDGELAAAKLVFAATARLLGRNTAGAGNGEEVTPAQARAMLDLEVGTDILAFAAAVSQAEAEAGTEAALRTWSPLRVAQAIAALGSGSAELDYVQTTSPVSITATTEGTAQTVLTSSSVTYDGTAVVIEFGAVDIQVGTSNIQIVLRDDTAAAIIGVIGRIIGAGIRTPMNSKRRLTPAAGARVYSIRTFVDGGTGTIEAGAGGSGNLLPAFIRITRA